jgi:hypothetical protein
MSNKPKYQRIPRFLPSKTSETELLKSETAKKFGVVVHLVCVSCPFCKTGITPAIETPGPSWQMPEKYLDYATAASFQIISISSFTNHSIINIT